MPSSCIIRRKYPRVPILIQVRYRTIKEQFSGFAEDLSAGGVFIATPKPLPPGTLLTLEFALPDSNEPLKVKGIVAWSRTNLSRLDQRRGMGIKFEGLTEKQKKRIASWVEKTKSQRNAASNS